MRRFAHLFQKQETVVEASIEPPKKTGPTVTATIKKRRLDIFKEPSPEMAEKIAKARGKRPGLECSTCEIGTNCPEFEDGSACAYDEEFTALGTRSKEEISAIFHEVVESNIERWKFARYAEKRIHGGAPTPEVTRLSNVVMEQISALIALNDQEESLTVEGDGEDNILASLFGGQSADAGIDLNPNPQLVEANPVVNPVPPPKEVVVVDAEV